MTKKEKRTAVGRVITTVGGSKLLKVGTDCPFKYGRHKRFNFSMFLKGLEDKHVRLTLKVLEEP